MSELFLSDCQGPLSPYACSLFKDKASILRNQTSKACFMNNKFSGCKPTLRFGTFVLSFWGSFPGGKKKSKRWVKRDRGGGESEDKIKKEILFNWCHPEKVKACFPFPCSSMISDDQCRESPGTLTAWWHQRVAFEVGMQLSAAASTL